MEVQTPADSNQSFLVGSAALVVWGDVNSNEVDEQALNDWWTNEHLPERLSIPGFLRARRYCACDDGANRTKYLTLYEVSSLETLTSEAYMEKLNNPTPDTQQHIPTLATMQRSACNVIRSEVRQDIRELGTGLGATVGMFVLSLPPTDVTGDAMRGLLSNAFSAVQKSNKMALATTILREDRAATEPGSSSQSYLNVKLKPSDEGATVKWIILVEFSSTARQPLGVVQEILKPVVDELSLAYGELGKLTFEVYEFIVVLASKKILAQNG